jgi:O-antigen/teichoic acid export membrane protein
MPATGAGGGACRGEMFRCPHPANRSGFPIDRLCPVAHGRYGHGMRASDGLEPVPGPMVGTRLPTGRETALVAIGQGALMLLGGVLALLVAQSFGKNAKTDAFFAAYGVYAVGLTFGQTFRLTAVSRLLRGSDGDPVSRLLGAVALMTLLLAVPMVLLADPLGRLLISNDPGHVAPQALRILWIALAGQLLAAMLATVLAVRAAFAAIGLATLFSGLVSIGTFLLVRSPLGILAAAVGLTASAIWLTAAFTGVLLRRGWRPARPTLDSAREMGSEAARLTFASGIFIGTNLAYVICVALATRQGKGEATLFAFAYVLAAMLVAVTANVSAMVRSPALIANPSRARNAAATGAWTFRFTLVLAGPVVAMALLVGKPVLSVVLGSGFSSGDVREILVTLLSLVGWILASAAGIFAIIELLARSELRRLAMLAVILMLAVLVCALAGGAIAGVEGIAAGLSVAMLGVTLVQLRWAFGEEWVNNAIEMLSATARELVVLASAFAPAAVLLLLLGETTPSRVASGALGAVLAVLASRVAWPGEFQALVGLVRRPQSREGQRQADEPETAAV